MAVTAVTPTRLVAGTFSADILVSDGVTATSTATDGTGGWAINLSSRGSTDKLIVILLDDGSGAGITVIAGDSQAPLRAKGNQTKTMAASDCFWFVPESGRFEQDDNTINIVSDDAGTKCIAFLMPVAQGGGGAIA